MKTVDGVPFECKKCGKCCRWEGYVFVTQEDIKKLADHLDMTVEEAKDKYTKEVDGKRVLKDKEKSDDCVFLKENLCDIFSAAPKQCHVCPDKYDKRCPGFQIKKEASMNSKFEDAVRSVNEKLSQTEDYVKAVTNNLYKDLQTNVKTASVATKAIEDGIDGFFDHNRIKVANLADLFAFERVDKAHLIHKSTHDLWSIQADNDGVSIARLFNDTGEPIKG